MKSSTKPALNRWRIAPAILGVGVIGTLTACGPGAQSPSSSPATTPTGESTSASVSAANFKDGTYSADGNYISPNGKETIGVKLTLKSNLVDAVEITTHPTNPNTKLYQGHFASGIQDVIKGKPVDQLKVDKVSGSSLTSGGFNEAVAKILKEAAA